MILHELGHAIPAIILSKEKVSIYIGSYGNIDKSINIKIGLLDVWLSYKILSWKNGLCIPSAKNISTNRQIIYILAGPICSFFFATMFIFFAYSQELSDSYLLFSVVFFVMAIFDLFGNLTPNSKPIKLFDGRVTYNDGYNIIKTFSISENFNSI